MVVRGGAASALLATVNREKNAYILCPRSLGNQSEARKRFPGVPWPATTPRSIPPPNVTLVQRNQENPAPNVTPAWKPEKSSISTKALRLIIVRYPTPHTHPPSPSTSSSPNLQQPHKPQHNSHRTTNGNLHRHGGPRALRPEARRPRCRGRSRAGARGRGLGRRRRRRRGRAGRFPDTGEGGARCAALAGRRYVSVHPTKYSFNHPSINFSSASLSSIHMAPRSTHCRPPRWQITHGSPRRQKKPPAAQKEAGCSEETNSRLSRQTKLRDLVLHRRAVLAAHAVVVARQLVGVVFAEADVVVATARIDLLVVLLHAGVYDAVGAESQRGLGLIGVGRKEGRDMEKGTRRTFARRCRCQSAWRRRQR